MSEEGPTENLADELKRLAAAVATLIERADNIDRHDFVTDAEIARRWNVSRDIARIAILAFTRNDPRFPKPDPMFSTSSVSAWHKLVCSASCVSPITALLPGAAIVREKRFAISVVPISRCEVARDQGKLGAWRRSGTPRDRSAR